MRDCIEKLSGIFFLAFPEKKDFLISEVSERFPHFGNPVFYGDLVYYPGASAICEGDVPYWCATAMLEPKKCEFTSIGEAARLLKEIQRN